MSQRAVVLHDKMTLRNLVVRPLAPLKGAVSLKVQLNGQDTGFKGDIPAGKTDPVACVGEMDIKRGDVISLAWLPQVPEEPMDVGFESRRDGAAEWFSLNEDGPDVVESPDEPYRTALFRILQQATRHHRATDAHDVLIFDLEQIEKIAKEALLDF